MQCVYPSTQDGYYYLSICTCVYLSLSPSSVTTIFGNFFLSMLPYQPVAFTDFQNFILSRIFAHGSPKPTRLPKRVYNGFELPVPLPMLLSF